MYRHLPDTLGISLDFFKKLSVLNRSISLQLTVFCFMSTPYGVGLASHVLLSSSLGWGTLIPAPPFRRHSTESDSNLDSQEFSIRLDSLALPRDVASLCVFHRIYHGECSEEVFRLIPTASFCHRLS